MTGERTQMSEHGAISQRQAGYPGLREIGFVGCGRGVERGERTQMSEHGAISQWQAGYPGLREIATMSTGVTV